MAWTRQRSTRLAMIVICLSALANVRLVYQGVRAVLQPRPAADAPGPFLARFEPLRDLLPADSVTGFIIDTAHSDPTVPHPDARFALAQYAVSPRLVDDSPAHELVIVDSDDPLSLPELAVASQWTLIADLRNGVRLYRTAGGQ